MKRLLALVLLVCLLFSGCQMSTNEPTEPEKEITQTTTKPPKESVHAPAKPTTEPTQTTTESVKPEIVTVYLLEKTVLFDSGYTQYFYDEDYNIDRSETFTIEDALMYTSYYEDKDTNGMPGKMREVWDQDFANIYTLIWNNDGNLKEIQGDSDIKYKYDTEGKLIEKCDYYEGEIFSVVNYEYDGDALLSVKNKDIDNNVNYKCRAENGRIVEKIYYDEGVISETYTYKYDINGNLEQTIYNNEEYTHPSVVYTYKAIEVDSNRATYLLEQQKYLLSSELEHTLPY